MAICRDPSQPPVAQQQPLPCGLYAARPPSAVGPAGTPGVGDWDRQHTCNRLYSPSLYHVLVLQYDGNLVLYRLMFAGATTGEEGMEVQALGCSAGNWGNALVCARQGARCGGPVLSL